MAKMLRVILQKKAQAVEQASEVQNRARLKSTSVGEQNLPLSWGKVTARTGVQTVDVELASGVRLHNVPVGSSRWVTKGTKSAASKASGSRDLPKVDAKVLVAFIDGVTDSAVVLPVSGFDVLVQEQAAQLLVSGQDDKVVDVDDYGWVQTLDKSTGEQILESPDGGIKVTLDPVTKTATVTADKINLAGTSPKAAREGDATVIDGVTDTAFIVWMATIGAFANAFGVVNTPPTSVAGKINAGSSKVNIG